MYKFLLSILMLSRLILLAPAQTTQNPVTSLFIPNDLWVTSFAASIAGSESTATTYVFYCDAEPRPITYKNKCGPVTLVEGPGTAWFNQNEQLITRVWECDLFPRTGLPTSASCLMSMTTPGYQFSGTETTTWAPGTTYTNFQLRKFEITAGSIPTDFNNLATVTSSSNGASAATSVRGGATATTTSSGAISTNAMLSNSSWWKYRYGLILASAILL